MFGHKVGCLQAKCPTSGTKIPVQFIGLNDAPLTLQYDLTQFAQHNKKSEVNPEGFLSNFRGSLHVLLFRRFVIKTLGHGVPTSSLGVGLR